MHSPELEERDTAAVLGLVEDLTTAQNIDEYAVITMTGLTELIPCIDASFNEMNPSANRIRWRSVPREQPNGRTRPATWRANAPEPVGAPSRRPRTPGR